MFNARCVRRLVFLWLLAFPLLTTAADLSAQVNWSQRVRLSSPVSGTVIAVLVDAGQRLQQGQVMLRLDPARLQAALDNAQAQVKDKKAALDEAEREQERAEELYAQTVLSDRDLQLAKNQFLAAQAVYQRALAQMVNAKQDLQDGVIRAPFDGVVISRTVEVGQTIVSRTEVEELFSFGATSHYLAQGQVSTEIANQLQVGQALDVSVTKQRFQGKVKYIGLEPVAGKDGIYPIDVEFQAGENILRVGQPAVIHLP